MTNRDMYVDVLKSKLDEWNARIDMLRVLTNLASQDARDEVEEHLDELRSKRDEFASKVEDFAEAEEEETEQAVRRSIDKIDADLKETFDEVKSSLAS